VRKQDNNPLYHKVRESIISQS